MDTARELLYAGTPEDFVATRRELARQARAAKDRALATRIEALRRPSRSAWLVNLLARDSQADLAELFSLAPLLAQMHTTGTPDQLRELTALRRRTLAALVQRAVELGRAAGRPVSDQVRHEVETCLEAALSHPEAAAQVLQGCLVKAPRAAAAFPMDLFEAPMPTSEPARLAPVVELPRDDAERERLREERERQRAAQEAQRARARALAKRVQELENRLATLDASLRETSEHRETTGRELESATTAHEEAASRLILAQQAVAAATDRAERARLRHEEAARREEDLVRQREALRGELEGLQAGGDPDAN